jgi:hypothetical protein
VSVYLGVLCFSRQRRDNWMSPGEIALAERGRIRTPDTVARILRRIWVVVPNVRRNALSRSATSPLTPLDPVVLQGRLLIGYPGIAGNVLAAV